MCVQTSPNMCMCFMSSRINSYVHDVHVIRVADQYHIPTEHVQMSLIQDLKVCSQKTITSHVDPPPIYKNILIQFGKKHFNNLNLLLEQKQPL